ncbi:MAG: TIGR03086 family metal-binding protein [Jatrophihabitans sp.]
MPQLPLEQLADALESTGRLIAGIRAEQWDEPTPCEDWSVRDLVEHLITGNDLFARALLAGSSSAATDPDRAPGQSGGAYRQSTAALLAAFGADGVMERVVDVPFGSVPGIVALHLRLVEALAHGWDLARATGQAPPFDEEIAEQELAFTRAKLAEIPAGRSPFGPPQPVADDAPALDRLAACLGRTVGASPM